MDPDDGFDRRWLNKAIPCHHWHFHRRLLERYGIVLAPGDFAQMVKDIRAGVAPRVAGYPDGRGIHWVRIASTLERIYVLVAGGHVITALPPNPQLNARRRRVMERLRQRKTGAPLPSRADAGRKEP